MCAVQEPRCRVVFEGTQAILPMERLFVRQLSLGGRETEGHGGSSGSTKVSSQIKLDVVSDIITLKPQIYEYLLTDDKF